MKIRRKYNNWIPQLLRVGAITLYPFILYKRSKTDLKRTPDYLKSVFKHEYIHIEQVRRLGWFKFYFLYLIESAKNGYRQNKYEVEAYDRQNEQYTEEEQNAFDEDFGK